MKVKNVQVEVADADAKSVTSPSPQHQPPEVKVETFEKLESCIPMQWPRAQQPAFSSVLEVVKMEAVISNGEIGQVDDDDMKKEQFQVKSEDEDDQDKENAPKPYKPRNTYPYNLKLQAVELAEELGNRGAARKLGVNESLVRRWRDSKKQLSVDAGVAVVGGRRRGRLECRRRAPPKKSPERRWKDVEEVLGVWYRERTRESQSPRVRTMTNRMIREKAEEIAGELERGDFVAGKFWIARFKERNSAFTEQLSTRRRDRNEPDNRNFVTWSEQQSTI